MTWSEDDAAGSKTAFPSRMIVEPHTRALLDEMAASDAPPIDQVPLAESRAALRTLMLSLDRPPVEGVESTETHIPGPAGPVPVTLHRPAGGDGALAAAVYLHGGGWARGDRDMYDRMCRYFAKTAHCLVANVEYRLSPEHPFPAGLDDSYAVVRWLTANGADWGADPARVAVLGDSAGANFSAAIALMARDQGLKLAFQGLIYPGLDLRRTDAYGSRFRYDNLYYFLDLKRLYWYFDHYLPTPADALDFRASPILADSHQGLAPAAIITAALDPLCDEGEAYARRLEASGNDVAYRSYAGTVHGFLSFTSKVPLGLEAQDWIADRLREALHGQRMNA